MPVDYELNSSGLYTTKTYQKQNNGWPIGYLTTSNNLILSLATFNDKCNFSVNKLEYTFESIDLSGKNQRFSANGNNQFDISFFAKPYAQSPSVEKGIMKSSVIISALYK